MSEDIDIKVLLEEVPDGYALEKGQTDRARLRILHRAVEACLTEMGFEYVSFEDKDNPMLRDSRRYYCLLVSYGAHFQDVSGALRPQLKLELIHRPPKLGVEALTGLHARPVRAARCAAPLHDAVHHRRRNARREGAVATAARRLEVGWTSTR